MYDQEKFVRFARKLIGLSSVAIFAILLTIGILFLMAGGTPSSNHTGSPEPTQIVLENTPAPERGMSLIDALQMNLKNLP